MHCRIFFFLIWYCRRQQCIADTCNIIWLGNRFELLKTHYTPSFKFNFKKKKNKQKQNKTKQNNNKRTNKTKTNKQTDKNKKQTNKTKQKKTFPISTIGTGTKFDRSFGLTTTASHSLSFYYCFSFMTLGWGLSVGPVAESCSQIWLPRLSMFQISVTAHMPAPSVATMIEETWCMPETPSKAVHQIAAMFGEQNHTEPLVWYRVFLIGCMMWCHYISAVCGAVTAVCTPNNDRLQAVPSLYHRRHVSIWPRCRIPWEGTTPLTQN